MCKCSYIGGGGAWTHLEYVLFIKHFESLNGSLSVLHPSPPVRYNPPVKEHVSEFEVIKLSFTP